jgi:hypothetical protein
MKNYTFGNYTFKFNSKENKIEIHEFLHDGFHMVMRINMDDIRAALFNFGFFTIEKKEYEKIKKELKI